MIRAAKYWLGFAIFCLGSVPAMIGSWIVGKGSSFMTNNGGERVYSNEREEIRERS